MRAIFVIQGTQKNVDVGDTLYVEKIEAKEGELLSFNEVLMLDGEVGTPTIKNAQVQCEVIKHGKKKKIHVIKFISQKHHMKKQGHRQLYTKLVVKNIKK